MQVLEQIQNSLLLRQWLVLSDVQKENKTYAKQYVESLEQLDALVKENPESKLGERLYYILKDFVAQLTDWEKEKKSSSAAELYKRTWAICRNFVLPMNPQRTELDFAVRKVLVDLGIQLKKKPRPRRAVRKTAEEK